MGGVAASQTQLLIAVSWSTCPDIMSAKIIALKVVLDEAIVKLNPDFFWLGGGEVDLKLGIKTSEFINFVRPFIVSCS
ncbi:hypothetical protein Pint_15896 [Pistacia integerrima]|uniref:Uncharacterized protein n=1 Tax=Pistacia integerrima TaxID=434235 RepID=A0ACC0ZBE9_9ROSI|nr:hypothetical protein Pint_15896 [Pistacia integerrima]